MDANKGKKLSVIENLEPRLMLSGTWDNVSEIFIEQGNFYHPDMADQANYSWEIGFEALESSVTSARFRPDSVADGWIDITETDTFDGVQEWFYELDFTDPAELTGYINETFVLEISFATSEVLSTSIALEDGSASPLAAPSQYPEFISPYQNQSAIAVDTTIVWQSITDSTINAVELNISDMSTGDFTDLYEFEMATTDTYSSPISLSASSIYGAELVYDNNYVGTTADGVATFASRYTASAVNFNTYTGLLDPIDSVYIERGYESSDMMYSFEFGIESTQTDWFSSAQIQSPTGQWTSLSDYYTNGVDENEWSTEFVNSSETVVNDAYPFGIYALDMYFSDGSFARTMFDFSDPYGTTGDPIAMPAQNPVFLSPTSGATDVAIDSYFSWETITDGNINMVELYVSEDMGGSVIDQEFSPGTTTHAQNVLEAGTTYHAELEYWNGSAVRTNNDGIEYYTDTFTQADIEFTTAGDAQTDVWDNITDAKMQVDVIEHEDSTVEYIASFAFNTPSMDWINGAELVAPSSNVYSLTQMTEPTGGYSFSYFLSSYNAADIADFASGNFTLRITQPDTSTVETTFAAVLNTVTDSPTITAPAAAATDVDVNTDPAWNASSDTAINEVRLMIYDVTDQVGVLDVQLTSDASGYDAPALAGGHDYSMSVGFAKTNTSSNVDGIPFSCDYVTTADISFTTAATTNYWANIDGTFMGIGTTAMADGSTEYWAEFGFMTSSVDWLTGATLKTPDNASHELFPQTPEDPQDTGAEFMLELASANPGDISSFTAGTYTLSITLTDSSVITTTFEVTDLTAPTQTPVFTNIANNDTAVAYDTSFTWETVTDPNIDHIFLEIQDYDSGEDVVETSLTASDTQFDQALLSGLTNYHAVLGFESFADISNADGLVLGVMVANETEISFTTGEGGVVNEDFALTQVEDVQFGAGMVENYGMTEYIFEILVSCASATWCENMEVSFDSGTTWQPFYQHFDPLNPGDATSFEWGLDIMATDISELSAYLNGTAQIRFSKTGETALTTDFTVSGMTVGITDVPTFTNPLDSSTDFAPTDSFSWNLPADASVTGILLDVYSSSVSEDGIRQKFDTSVGSYTASAAETLMSDTSYQAELTFVAEGAEASNTDGVSYSQMSYRASIISFMTAAQADHWANIDGSFLGVGTTALADGSTEYWAEFNFYTPDTDWLAGATLITPDSTSYTFVQQTPEDPQETGAEFMVEVEGASSGDIAAFTTGTYTLQVTLADSSTIETTFEVTDLTAPTQLPAFTNIANNATDVAYDSSFTWETVTDNSVDSILFEIEDASTGEEIVWASLASSDTQYDQASLSGLTDYLAILGFESYQNVSNTDGLSLGVVSSIESEIAFTTSEGGVINEDFALTQVNKVDFSVGMVEGYGGTNYVFEILVDSASATWCESMEVSFDSGTTWQPFYQHFDTENPGTGTSFEWGVDVVATDIAELSAYLNGTAQIRFNKTGETSLTTDFAVSAMTVAITDVPTFTSPLDSSTDVAVDGSFNWNLPADASVTSITLDVFSPSAGEEGIRQIFGVDVSSYTPSAAETLLGGTIYDAELSLVAEGTAATNTDGVAYSQQSYRSSIISFTTAGAVNHWANIDGSFMGIGTVTLADNSTEYWADFGFHTQSTDWLTAATLITPDSASHELMQQTPEDPMDTGAEFMLEIESASALDIASFTTGTYTLQVTLADSSVIETTFEVTDLTAPTQSPNFTNIANNATDVAFDTSFTWDAVTDSAVNNIFLEVEDAYTGEDVIEASLAPSDTQFDQNKLSGLTDYFAVLGFESFSQLSSSDGLGLGLVVANETEIAFTTAEGGAVSTDWQNVTGVYAAQGQTTLPDSSVEYFFEMGFNTDSVDWFTSASMQAPDGTWYTLEPDMDDGLAETQDGGGDDPYYDHYEYSFELVSATAADLDVFGLGTYTLKVVLADSSEITTTFDVTSMPDMASAPSFVTPLDGATDVATDVTFQWNLPATDTADAIELEIESDTGDMDIWESFAPTTDQYAQDMLLGATTYSALLSFVNFGQITNSDGLVLMTGTLNEAEISFTTADDGSNIDPVLSNIADVAVSLGAVNMPDGTTEYLFNVSLASDNYGWFDTAELYAGSQWVTLQEENSGGVGEGETGGFSNVWSFGISDTNLLNLMPYASGSYAIKFTLADSTTVTTDFGGSTIGIGVTQTPTFTTPANGATDVAIDTDFAWQALTDVAVDDVSLELSEPYSDYFFKLPVDMANNSATLDGMEMLYGEQYAAILTFFAQGDSLTNEDGVPYHVDTFQSTQADFTTEQNPWMNVGGVFIEQGSAIAPDGTTDYWFEGGFETFGTEWFTAARLQGPDGTWYDLTLNTEDGDDYSFEYGFELISSLSSDLDIFGDGSYTLEITLADSSVITTGIDVSGVADVTQVPEFITPPNGQTDIDPDTIIEWAPVTDTNVGYVELMISDDQLNNYVDDGFMPDVSSYQGDLLPANTHLIAELCFISENMSYNADGINVLVARGIDRQIEFTTGNGIHPEEHIYGLDIERGQVNSDKGTEYVFEFILTMDDISFFDTIEFNTGSDQWYQLYQYTETAYGEGEDDPYDFTPVVFVYENFATITEDLADFDDGTYTLRFTMPDTTTFETSLNVVGLLAGVSQQPEFTNPLNNAAEVPVDTVYSWNPVTDSSVTDIELEVMTQTGIPFGHAKLSSSDSSYALESDLLEGVDYAAELTFFGSGQTQTNNDNIAYNVNTYSTSQIDFSSAGSMDVAALMQNVFFDQGIVEVGQYAGYSGQAETEYFFEFGFETDVENWFDYAMLMTPSDYSYSIYQMNYGEGEDVQEWGFEYDTTDPLGLSEFGFGTYTLELSLISGQSLSIDFEIDSSQLTTVEQPEFISPVDGDIDIPVDGSIQWNVPTDSNVDAIYAELFNVDTYETVLEADLGSTSDSLVYNGLDDYTGYEASLEFIASQQAQNSNGINFQINSISASEIRFTTHNPWSDLAMFNIDRGVASMADGAHYILNAGMVLSGEIAYDSATLTSPNGMSAQFVQIYDSSSDGDGLNEGEEVTSQWKLLLDTVDPIEALNFGVGTYTLTVGDSVSGYTMSTDFYFDDYLAAPTQIPNITTPDNGSADITIDSAFAWDAVTDSTVSNMYFTLWGEGGETVEMTELTPDQGGYQLDHMLNFNYGYTAQLSLHSSQQTVNEDDVNFTISNFTSTQAQFNTLYSNLSVAENIKGLEFLAGQAQTNSNAQYSPGMVRLFSDTSDWVEMIEISVDGQSWLELDRSGDGTYGYMWKLGSTLIGDMTQPVQMRFTMPGGETETTSFTLDMDSATTPAIPQLTTPSADATNAMEPDGNILWQANSDAIYSEIVIYDAENGDMVYMGSADAGVNSIEADLEPDHNYTVTVRHIGQMDDLNNADGVMCRYGSYSQYSRDFRTGFYSNLWKMIDVLDIVKGRITRADGQTLYSVEVSLESSSDTWYTTAWAKASKSAAFDDAHELRVDHDNDDPEMYIRTLEIESSSITDVAEFVDGQWYLKIQTATGTQQILLDVSGLNTSALPAPVITSPLANNPAVMPGTPITWEPINDPDVMGIFVEILDSEGNIVEETELDASVTGFTPSEFDLNSSYTVRVAAVGYENSQQHEEGFEYLAMSYQASEISFTTAASDNVWDMLGSVEIEQGENGFEIFVHGQSDDWFDSLEIQDLSGNWYALTPKIDPVQGDGLAEGESVEYSFFIDIDQYNVADFGSGTYTLRLTLIDGTQYTTSLEFSDQLAAPLAAPQLIGLSDGQVGYDPSMPISWEAVTDSEVDEIWFMLEDADGNELTDQILATDATSFSYDLLGGQQYTVSVAFVNFTTQSNADGVSYNTAIISEAKASFQTTSPMESIYEVFIDQGIEYTNGLSPEYSLEFGFISMADSVSSARFRLDGDNTSWVNLTESDDADYDDEWIYEVNIDSASQLAAWTDSQWIFEFTFANGQTLSTSLAQADDQINGTALVQPEQIPTFENIYSNMTIRGGLFAPQWSEIIDENVTALELEVSSMYGSEEYSSDSTSETTLGEFDLQSDTVYFASLLADNAREGINADGVNFFVTKYISNTVEFNTYASLFDSLSSIEMHAGDAPDATAGEALSNFSFEITNPDDNLLGAQLITPDGTTAHLEKLAVSESEYRWSYNGIGTSSDFAYGEYTLVLITSELTAHTSFEYSADLAAMPADSPVFVSPAASETGVRPNATIQWVSPTDVNTSSVHLSVSDMLGNIVIDTDVATDQSELVQSELGFSTTYDAKLDFANMYSLTNDLGVSYTATTTATASTSFTTAAQLRPLDIVSDVYIQRGYMELPSGQTPSSVFTFGMTTVEADQIISAQLLTPTGESYTLDAASPSSTEYGYLWSLEQATTAPGTAFGFGDMSDFISGTYTLQMQVNDIETVSTSFLLDSSIASPATPEFTVPLDGETNVPYDVRLQWNQITDAANLLLTVTDTGYGYDVIETMLSPYTVKYAQDVLAPQSSYTAELVAANGYASLANADGVTFSVSMYSGQKVEFTTAELFNPISELTDVNFSKGFVSDAGQTKLAFAFGMSLDQVTLASARLQSPDGTWYDLSNGSTNWTYEVESATAADLAGFTSGFYTVEMTSQTGQVVSTSFEVSGMQPPLPARMVSPVSAQADFDINTSISWTPSASATVTAQSLVITNTATSAEVYSQILASGDSQVTTSLDYETGYTLELSSIADAAAQTSSDGVAFTSSSFAAQRISFTTAAEFNPLENIQNVGIHAAMIAPQSGSEWFLLDMNLDLVDASVFESLEYQLESQWLSSSDLSRISIATTDMGFRDSLLAAGTLPVRIGFGGGQTVVTEIPLPAAVDIPATSVTITAPVNAASDVAPSADITWTTDGSDELMLMLAEGAFSETPDNIVYETMLDAATTSASIEGIEYSSDYTVYVGKIAQSSGTSGDGLSYSIDVMRTSAVEFTTVDATVDLTVTLGAVTGLEQMNLWGATGGLSVTVTNTGTSLAEGNVTVSAYLSVDGYYDPADTLIGSASSNVSLDAAASELFSLDLEIPSQLTPGDYTLVIVAESDAAITEDSITNNEIVGDVYGVDAPTVDLVGSINSIEFTEAGRVIAGYSGTVAVQVENTGNIAAAGNCTVTVYASESQTLDDTAMLVGTKLSNVVLAAGGTANFDVAIKIPTTTATGYYYFFAVIDSANTIVEGDEYNNQTMWDAPVAIESQVVDLTGEIISHSFGPAALAGTAGMLDLTLINQGNWPISKSVVVTIYASTTGTIDAQAVQVGKASARKYLDADGGMEDISVKVILPKTMANGDYYFVAEIDSTDLVAEQNEVNNQVVSGTTLSIEEPFVDLGGEITDTGFSGDVIAGEKSISVVSVTNSGNVKAVVNGAVINVYLSTTLDIADGQLLTQQKIAGVIQPGDSKDYKIKLTLPEELDTSYYYMIAQIDAEVDTTDLITGNVEESSEANNTVIAETQVSVVARQVDLEASITESSLHAMPMPGARGKVVVNIANIGNVPNDRGDVVIHIYGSVDGNVDAASDMLIGTQTLKGLVLKAGDSRDVSVNVTVPDDAVSEIYNMIAVIDVEDDIDELDETINNQALADETFEVVEPFTDLACEVTEADFDGSVLPGDRGKITVSVTNLGNIPARDLSVITIYASDNETAGAGSEMEIASMNAGINIAGGASKDFKANVIIPDDVELFDTLYFVAVITPSDTFVDADSTNDSGALGGPALADPVRDLTGEILNYKLADAIIAGDRCEVRVKVSNEGNVSANGDMSIGVYAKAVGDPLAAGILIGDAIVDPVNIAAGKNKTYNFRLEIPSTLESGVEYQFYVDIDTADAINEVIEDNNTVDIGLPTTFVQRFGTFGSHRNETLTLTDGLGNSADFTIIGDGYGEVTNTIDGYFAITLSGTSSKSRLLIEPVDETPLDIYSIDADNDLGAIDAEDVNLLGSINILGGLGQAKMNNIADQHELNVGGDGSMKMNLIFKDVSDLSITSDTPINSLEVNSWIDTDGDDMITAPWIGSIRSDGDFKPNMTLTGVDAPGSGTLNKVDIAGSVNDSDSSDTDWDITGDINSLNLSGIVNNFAISADSIKNVNLGNAESITLDLTGDLNSLKADSLYGGDISAGEIKSVNVDSVFAASLATIGDLGSVNAGLLSYGDGSVVDWDITGSVNSIQTDSISNFRMLAGDGLRTLNASAVTNSSLGQTGESVGDINLIKVDSWSGGEIIADSIANLNVSGDFGADMTVGIPGELAFRTAKIDGGITGGTWSVSGDMGVFSVAGDLSGWTLDLGTAELKKFSMGNATNVSITAGDIGTVTADSWAGGTINADIVKMISVSDNAEFDMVVTGDVGTVKTKTDITGGSWDVTGQISAVNAINMDSVDIIADSVKNITLKGNLTDSSITTEMAPDARAIALGKLSVSGTMDSTAVRSVGSIGTVNIGKMLDSVVFAGVASDYDTDANSDNVLDMPLYQGDFDTTGDVLAQIKSISVKGNKNLDGDLFTNSSIAAGQINNAFVKNVTTDNAAQGFGLAAVEGVKLTWQQDRSRYVFGRNWPSVEDAGDFTVIDTVQEAPGSPWFHRS